MRLTDGPSARLGAATLSLVFLAACGGGGPSEQPERPLPNAPDRAVVVQGAVLGAGDVLEVRVYQEEGLTGVFRIDTDGTFQYPLIGQVKGADQTPAQLATEIMRRLKASYLRNPQVTVFVKESRSKKVFVLGEVHRPGTFAYEDNMSIVQALTLAGGFKSLADKNRTVLTRVIDGTEKKYILPVEKIGSGHEANVLLQPGDIIFVPESWL